MHKYIFYIKNEGDFLESITPNTFSQISSNKDFYIASKLEF